MSARERSRQRVEGFHIGLRLVRRDIKKWTQKELAVVATEVARRQSGDPSANVSASLVAMIESKERNPSLEVAEWLAEAVGYKVDDLGILLDVVEIEPARTSS